MRGAAFACCVFDSRAGRPARSLFVETDGPPGCREVLDPRKSSSRGQFPSELSSLPLSNIDTGSQSERLFDWTHTRTHQRGPECAMRGEHYRCVSDRTTCWQQRAWISMTAPRPLTLVQRSPPSNSRWDCTARRSSGCSSRSPRCRRNCAGAGRIRRWRRRLHPGPSLVVPACRV